MFRKRESTFLPRFRRGDALTADALNRIAQAVFADEIKSGDVITADWLNSLAEKLNERSRKQVLSGRVDECPAYRAGRALNVSIQRIPALSRGDVITAEWLNRLVDGVNALRGQFRYEKYFYYPEDGRPEAAETHPFKVTFVPGETPKFRVEQGRGFSNNPTNSSEPGVVMIAYGPYFLAIPEYFVEGFVVLSAEKTLRSVSRIWAWPFDSANPAAARPFMDSRPIYSAGASLTTNYDDTSEWLIARVTVVRDGGGAIGANIEQVLHSDIAASVVVTGKDEI